ncbi:hypothetical protein [Acrocarpospora sp. B8E8]|uniref:hypothetical protein n=1 Tax=Acrocarpospora sp. B8E8 TaxID=3153572 RepID=UPI00325E6483
MGNPPVTHKECAVVVRVLHDVAVSLFGLAERVDLTEVAKILEDTGGKHLKGERELVAATIDYLTRLRGIETQSG